MKKIFSVISQIFAFILLCILTTPVGAIIITITLKELDEIKENTRKNKGNEEQE